MPDLETAAQARADRRAATSFADRVQRAARSVNLMLEGYTPREKLLALHLVLDKQLKIDQARRTDRPAHDQ